MASLGLYSKQLTPVLRCALPTTNRLVPRSTTRLFSISNKQRQSSNDDHPKPIKVDGHSSGGGFSRTQPDIRVEYPEGKDLPKSKPVQGRGGKHFKRTLATFSLEGKTCVVTGGARGLGYVMGQGFLESGANLAIVDLNGPEAEKSAMELKKHFEENMEEGDTAPKVTAHACDVSKPDAVNQTFQNIIDEHGDFDVLVTSAGFTENFKAEDYPHDRMQKLWGVNVDGTYLCSTAAGRHWIKNGKKDGSIIMIGSMSGAVVNVPQPQAPYNAAKAAVRSLAQSLAVEWAGHGIRVNCISPGYMLTALTQKILDENPSLKAQWLSLIPTGKMGNPVDLMGITVYLASDASKYTTGADFRIDGGYTCT